VGDAAVDAVGWDAGLDEVAVEFGEDVGGPQGSVRLGVGEAEQGVAQVDGVEHAGV
jgi:hypothetical protein